MRWFGRKKPEPKMETCEGCYEMLEVPEGQEVSNLDKNGWCKECRDKFDQAVLAALPSILVRENNRDRAVVKARQIAFTFMDLRKSGKPSEQRRPKL